MVEWTEARAGYVFQPTVLGMTVGRIRVKYDTKNPNYTQYLRKVPSSWLKDHFVVEVLERTLQTDKNNI